MIVEKIIKNKRATSSDNWLSGWMFFIWGIVGVSIVVGYLMVLGILADSRLTEAGILQGRLTNCISTDFDYNEIASADFNVYEKCNLNQNVLEDKNFYYFNISIRDSSGENVKEITKGFGIFETQCLYQLERQKTDKDFKENNFAQCSLKQSNDVTNKNTGEKYTLIVLAASNQK
jgi:hypothetical protein